MFSEFSLSGFNPGHMSVTVESNPVRFQLAYFFNRICNALFCLQRKPVNQIVVDGLKADFPGCVRNHFYLIKRLKAVYNFLDAFIKILYAETQPAKTKIKK